MSEENDEQPKEVNENQVKAAIKLEALKAVRALSNGDSPFTLTQEIMQEIHASHIVINPDKQPSVPQMVEELKKEIELRYDDEEETKKILLESIPSVRNIRNWLKKEGWEEAVWKKVRG